MYYYLIINFSDVINECRIMTLDEYPDNDLVISSSCKTALHHTAPKKLKIFFETTRPISLAHKNWHRIRQIWIR